MLNLRCTIEVESRAIGCRARIPSKREMRRFLRAFAVGQAQTANPLTRLRNHFIFPAQTSAVQKTVGFMWSESRVFTDLSFACAEAPELPEDDQIQQSSVCKC